VTQSTDTPSGGGAGKPWWKKRWGIAVIAIAVFLAIGAIGNASKSGSAGEAPSPSPTEPVAAATVATEPTPSPTGVATPELTPAATEAPTAAPTPAPVPTATPAPVPKPIVLTGSGSRKTKAFTMRAPARVDLTFSGSGNFISSIVPVGGDIFSGVSLSNTIGKTKLRTYVYEADLDGVRSYADVIASSGSWTITITAGVPSPVAAPASFSGKWGLNTQLVRLSGDYTVTFSHAGSGNFIVQLAPVDGSLFGGESIANEIGRVKDSTEVYGVEGDYYFDVVANGAWTISIKAQT
jgi:hypothetical protein